jgi:hypothetical protein
MSLPNIDHHIVVIRQKERKKSKQKHQEIRHFGPEKSKKKIHALQVFMRLIMFKSNQLLQLEVIELVVDFLIIQWHYHQNVRYQI